MGVEPQTLFEDVNWWVVNKAAGVLTTSPTDLERDRALVDIARDARPGAVKMHATSRLDRGVTGIVVLAKTSWAIATAIEARASKQYARRYVGLCHPRADHTVKEGDTGTWEESIGIAPKDRTLRAVAEDHSRLRGAKKASTRYQVEAVIGKGVLIALYPQTGRTHQLRVHASHAGLPLWGDRAYFGPDRHTFDDGRVLSARRPMLHCNRVSLPTARGIVSAEAPVPDDMVRFWTKLGGDSAQLTF